MTHEVDYIEMPDAEQAMEAVRAWQMACADGDAARFDLALDWMDKLQLGSGQP